MTPKAKIGIVITAALIVGYFVFRKKTTLPIASGGNSAIPTLSTNLNTGPNGLLSLSTKIQSKPTGAKVYKESDQSLLVNYPGAFPLGAIKNYSSDLKYYVIEASVSGVLTNLLVGVNDVDLYVKTR